MSARRIGQRVAAWWCDDLPPMSGRLRLVFYGGLLLLAFRDEKSPIRATSDYSLTEPEMFRAYGLMELLGLPHLSLPVVHALIAALVLVWTCAAIGLFRRTSAILTAALFVLLHGLFLGSNAFNHNWFVPMDALVVLAFARTTDDWSVDGWLRRRRGVAPPPRDAGTGLSRKALLVLVVGFYFGAGICKLQTAGWEWSDGHSIAYFAEERGQYTLIGTWVAGQPELCRVMGTISTLLEAGAVLALVGWRLRYLFLAGWTSMHVGINLVMGPDYWENVWCFGLLIDWGQVRGWARRITGREGVVEPRPATEAVGVLPVALASLLLPLIAFVAFKPVFWWPLTNVYMYCSYFSLERDIRAGHPASAFRDPMQVQQIARRYLAESPPIEDTEFFAYRVGVRLAWDDGATERVRHPPGVADEKHFVLVISREVVIEDMAAKPDGRLAFDPEQPDTPAQRFLEEYAPVFLRVGHRSERPDPDRLELVYSLDERTGEEVALASVELP